MHKQLLDLFAHHVHKKTVLHLVVIINIGTSPGLTSCVIFFQTDVDSDDDDKECKDEEDDEEEGVFECTKCQ